MKKRKLDGPVIMINRFFRDDFRIRVIETALKFIKGKDSPASLSSKSRKCLIVKGYAKRSYTAPVALLKEPAESAFKFSNEFVRDILNGWILANTELCKSMCGFLKNSGFDADFPVKLDLVFESTHSDGEMKKHCGQFGRLFSQYDKDDIQLMYCCVRKSLPKMENDSADDVETSLNEPFPAANKDNVMANTEFLGRISLDNILSESPSWESIRLLDENIDAMRKYLNELERIREEQIQELEKISVVRDLLNNIREKYVEDLDYMSLEVIEPSRIHHWHPDQVEEVVRRSSKIEDYLKHYQLLRAQTPKNSSERKQINTEMERLESLIRDEFISIQRILDQHSNDIDEEDSTHHDEHIAATVESEEDNTVDEDLRNELDDFTYIETRPAGHKIVSEKGNLEETEDAEPFHASESSLAKNLKEEIATSPEDAKFNDSLLTDSPGPITLVDIDDSDLIGGPDDILTTQDLETIPDLNVTDEVPLENLSRMNPQFDVDTTAKDIAFQLLNAGDEQLRTHLHKALMWKLLDEERPELAYNIASLLDHSLENAERIPAWLLKSLSLAPHVSYDSGHLATILTSELAKFSESIYLRSKTSWNQAVRLLLIAVALRPSLVAPSTNAGRILLSIHKKENLSRLHEYITMVGEYANRRHPLDLRLILNSEQLETQLERLKSEVENWWARAHQTTTLYQVATKVWISWLDKGQLIERLISIIRNNALGEAELMRSEIERLGQDREIKTEIRQAQRRLGGKIAKSRIEGKALTQLTNYLGKPLDFCNNWLSLIGTNQEGKRSDLDSRASRLLHELSQLRDPVIKEIDALISQSSSFLEITVAAHVLKKALLNVDSIIQRTTVNLGSEPEIRFILNKDFLRIPDLDLDAEWNTNAQQTRIISSMLESIVADNYSWQSAFEMHEKDENHGATEKIIELLRSQEKNHPLAVDLEIRRNEALEHARHLLRVEITETYQEIEQAVAHGWLDEAKRLDLQAKAENVESSVDLLAVFKPAHEILRDVSSNIADLRVQEINKANRRLHQSGLANSSAKFKSIKKYIADGDIATANDYIDAFTTGREISEEAVSENPFAEFFPEKARLIEDYLERAKLPTVVADIKNRTSKSGVNLRKITGTQASGAAEMMEAWLSIKMLRKIDQACLSTVLTRLGFTPVKMEIGLHKKPATINLTCLPIGDKKQCPVSKFGSETGGRYKIYCVWDKEGADDIIRMVGDDYHSAPIMVLYFGRLTEGRRRDLARISVERKKTFLVLDDILMFYVCSERDSRMLTMFRCALPFTWLEPYTTTAGIVPTEMFYGRNRERNSIIDPMGSCFLYGGRQLGKTALLRDIVRRFHDPEKGQIAVWIDLKLEGICQDREIDWIWHLIATNLVKENVLPANLVSHTGPEKLLDRIENWLMEDLGRRILLLLDEADLFLNSDAKDFSSETREGFIRVSRLKGLMDRTDRRFKVVFAGLHNVQRTTRQTNQPLAHFGEPLCIGPLLDNGEWREAKALAQVPFETMGFRFESPQLVTRILSRTNYYPNLIQLYCQHLLRQLTNRNIMTFDLKQSPPYIITSQHLEKTYADQDLYKSIRDKFMLTIDLDSRYKVIAYTIALKSINDYDESAPEGMTVSAIRKQVLSWWPDGFKNSSSHDSLRVLLEEMVGLGVLREAGEGRFALRSPNVKSLMGSQSDIESVLLESSDNEPPLEYDAFHYRAAFRNPKGLDLTRRSPITAQQDSEIRNRRHGVTILFGSEASGILELTDFLGSSTGKDLFTKLEDNSSFHSFKETLERVIKDYDKRKHETTTVVYVPHMCVWNESWVDEAARRCSKLISPSSFVRVVFSADPSTAWNILKKPSGLADSLVTGSSHCISLHPWSELTLRQWLEDCGVVQNDPDTRAQIREVTGNWPYLLYRFRDLYASYTHKWGEKLNEAREWFADTNFVEIMDTVFGLYLTEPRMVLTVLHELEEADENDILEVMSGELPANIISKALLWAEKMFLVQVSADGKWILDPVIKNLLEAR